MLGHTLARSWVIGKLAAIKGDEQVNSRATGCKEKVRPYFRERSSVKKQEYQQWTKRKRNAIHLRCEGLVAVIRSNSVGHALSAQAKVWWCVEKGKVVAARCALRFTVAVWRKRLLQILSS